MLRCQACSGAHNLTIAAPLASLDALPDSMILAASPGFAMCMKLRKSFAGMVEL